MLVSLSTVKRSLLLWIFLLLSACQAEPDWQTSNISGALPELSFSLTDAHQNKTVSADDFKDKVVMLFFGFTHCPEVCPTTLLLMQQATLKLEDKADQVRILFVSVDPERDDLVKIKQYAENFGPQTVGLRADDVVLKALTKKYHISYAQQAETAEGNYDVEHSSQVYVFDRQGQARLLFRSSDSIDAIVNDLNSLIAE